MKGEVFLQAEELLFCLLFLSRKKVRAYFEEFFSASAEQIIPKNLLFKMVTDI
jgi:hypothetical protein